MISSGTADLPTVPLELPETGYSAPEFQLPAASEESAPCCRGWVAIRRFRRRQAFLPHAPRSLLTPHTTEGASLSRWGAKDASIGEPAATPITSVRELPVVARSVDPSLGAEASRPPRSTESVVSSRCESLKPATAIPELPVVSRSAEPTESRPR